MYDLVIKDALIVDGTGSATRRGSVAIRDGLIEKVGGEITPSDAPCIDAEELVLSPGFIDVHSHDDFAALHCPDLTWKVTQGVTTEVVGNCGIGVAPFPGAEDWYEKLHPGQALPGHKDYSGYLERLDEAAPSLNIAVLAGHGALRRAAYPNASRSLGSAEVGRVGEHLEEAMEAGVFGMSAGLIYEPGVHADKAELIALARRLQGYAPLFTVHLRSEADDLLHAVREAIEIASEAEVGLQLSHHKAHGRNNWGKVRDSLALVDDARDTGLDVWVDQYPYTAGSTILSAVMERGGLQGGAALGELRASDIVIASTSVEPNWEGQSLADLAKEWSLSPEKAAERVLVEDPGVWVVVHAMAEEDVRTVLRHPRTLVGSDGLPTSGGRPHPRLWGTFPRILGHYVRDEGLLGLEEAIAKMTGRAAERFGMVGRGRIEEGAHADLVLFDPQTIAAQATFEDPTAPASGITGVWVNGVRVVDRGKHTGARSGRALRRSAAGADA